MPTFLDKLSSGQRTPPAPNPNPPPQPPPPQSPAEPPEGETATPIERETADKILSVRPNAVATAVVPEPWNDRPEGQADQYWFSNVVYWLVYRHPSSPWIVKGNPPAPVKIPNGQSPWAQRWVAIHDYVRQQLLAYDAQGTLGGGADNTPPPPQPPQPVPLRGGAGGLGLGAATVPAAGPITATEQSIANNVIRTRPVAVSTSIVPSPMNTRTALVGSDAAWFANVTYWLAYRHPANPWRKAGNPAGPVTFTDPDGPWAERWKVIYSYIQLALSLGVDDIPPLGDVPTRFEEDAGVFYMSQGGEQGDYDVDPDVIPPPQNTPPPGVVDHHTWATNVVYWLTYVYPTSTWVATGHAPAPIKIPGPDRPWAAVWTRIYHMLKKYK